MARDPLAVLARLRALDVRGAQRDLAEARAALARAQDAIAATDAALRAEQPGGVLPCYGAFLGHALAKRDAQAAVVTRAEADVDAEREALALARGAEKVLDILRERRAASRRREVARREQARLEDAAPRG